MPARLRPTPTTTSSTKSVRVCGNVTVFSTTLGCVCSRSRTCLRNACGLAIFLGPFSDPSIFTISRIAFAGFRERNLRITCSLSSRSARAIGMRAERFIGLCCNRSYPVIVSQAHRLARQNCGKSRYSCSPERGAHNLLAAQHLRSRLCQLDVAFLSRRIWTDHGVASTAVNDHILGHHLMYSHYLHTIFHARSATHHFLF